MTRQVGPGLSKPENLSETNDLAVRMRHESADFIGARSEADCKKAECRAATHPVDQNTRKPGAKGAVHVDKFGAGFARCAESVRRKPGNTWHLDEMFVTLARRAVFVVARGRRAWPRTRRVGAKASQQGRGEALLSAGVAFKPSAEKDRYRPTAQLSGGEG